MTRIAIIGTGLIGSHYARICRQMFGVTLVALQDAAESSVGPLARELGVPALVGTDYSALLQTYPNLDAVLVCTPERYHLQPALAVLQAGKHLLVEKPLASTEQDARALVEAAERSPGLSMVAYSLRFDPRYAAVKRMVDRGEIGDLIYLHAQRNPALEALLRIQGRVDLPFWVGVHDIDMLRWITGSEIRRVYAAGNDKELEGRGPKRVILTTLTFENGVVAALENYWRAESLSNRPLSEASFRANGTRGAIELYSNEQGLHVVHDGQSFAPDTINMGEIGGEIIGIYRNQIAAFVRAIRDGAPSPVPLREGLQGTRVAAAILRSLELGQPVDL